MNKKLIIKNTQNEIIQTCIFHEQETLDTFLAMIASNATFGKPEHTVEVSPASTVFHPAVIAVAASEAHGIIPAVFDNHGNELSPMVPAAEAVEAVQGVEAFEEVVEAVFEVVASEYSVEIVDVTAEIEQEKKSDEAKAYLASTDYLIIRFMDAGTTIPISVQDLRAAARLKVIPKE